MLILRGTLLLVVCWVAIVSGRTRGPGQRRRPAAGPSAVEGGRQPPYYGDEGESFGQQWQPSSPYDDGEGNNEGTAGADVEEAKELIEEALNILESN